MIVLLLLDCGGPVMDEGCFIAFVKQQLTIEE